MSPSFFSQCRFDTTPTKTMSTVCVCVWWWRRRLRCHHLVSGCYRTSINTWQCCCPSAVTQSTKSPFNMMKLCQCGRALFIFLSRSNPLISSSWLSLSLSLSFAFRPITLSPVFHPLSLSSQCLFLSFSSEQLLSLPSCPVSLFLASVWLWLKLERRKQGDDCRCLFPFLLFWRYLWLKLL